MTQDPSLHALGLEGRVAIVTGAASGIGRAAARILAAAGAKVVAVDIDRAGLSATHAALGTGEHVAEEVDLADLAACESLIAGVAARAGRLDILLNVAGVLRRLEIDDVDATEWRRLMDVNLRSQYFLCRAAGEAMKPRHWGRIVNFSSGAGLIGGFFGSTAYAITKAGTITLTKSFAKELGPHGITVNTLSPGSIDTPMQHTGMTPQTLEIARSKIPLGRMGDPVECARGAVFLASELASYVTGHVLSVDGGLLMR
ncbi:MAG: SDR family NAD(P)-dependent oxidoreductase [Rhodospirillales bacterium]|jgi:NAD(P)-dependent dehydrogenase (short-subunit alcohol dehydrogenase family)